MIQSRKSIIEKAILNSIGSHRELSIEKHIISEKDKINEITDNEKNEIAKKDINTKTKQNFIKK